MQITRQADYALRTVVYLAGKPPEYRSATNIIAREKQIPNSFLAKIISQLSIAGLISTTRGAHGGVCLARPANSISVLDVIEAIDGPIRMNECTANPSICPFIGECSMYDLWCNTRDELVTKLRETKLSQVA